jgi:oligopeptidase B
MTLTPPTAVTKPYELTLHGHTRVDPYYWLREKTNPDVIAYLEAENAYTEAMTAHTKPLQEKLYQEMVGRIQETDATAPERRGNYYYYSRTEAGKQYDIHCRKQGSLDAPEEIILDLNVIAESYKYLSLALFKPSPNNRLLAYTLDTEGGEDHTMFIKDMTTGQLLPDQIPHVSFSADWASDNQTIFYTMHNEAWRPDKLYRHTVSTSSAADQLVFHEPDELYRLFLRKTKDGAYLLLQLISFETTEIYYLDADTPTATFRAIHPRQKGLRYTAEHYQGNFYILSNEDAPNNKLMVTPVHSPGKDNWQEYLRHRPDALIEDIEPFANHLVIYGRQNGLRSIRVTDMRDGGQPHDLAFPEPVYSYNRTLNPEFDTNLLRFSYTSLTTADSVYDYDMDSRQWELKKRKPVLGGYSPDNYQSERIFATAPDGAQVPISLFYRKGTQLDGNTPCLLYGYGSYGASMDPTFNANRLSLVDRGMIFAIAHIRGGQEMGRAWYDQGKYLHKKNTFTDFIASAQHLINNNYTNSNRLAIMGRSAGGLLIGAAVTMAPELFHVAVAGVPFVDVVTTMLDASIPLTTLEWEEWGNPNNEEYYHYMLSYSPYDNTTAKDYPNLLILAGLNDPRVQYWEPAKWTARMRALRTNDTRLLLKTHMGAGHFSSSGRYDYLKDIAFEFAFILDCLEITD